MKNKVQLLLGVAGAAVITTAAQASFVSTINISQADYLITGFASGGPLSMQISNATGSYSLDIPASGSYSVFVESTFMLDSNRDGITDGFFTTGLVDLGMLSSPGASSAWSATGMTLPNATFEVVPGSPFTLSGVTLDMDIDLDGPYPGGAIGSLGYANMTFSGGNLAAFNAMLTQIDNTIGGGDGLFDGYLSGMTTVTVSVVPIPAAALPMLAMLGGGLGYRRLRNR